MESLGIIFKKLRKSKLITLARAQKITGISKSYLSKFENDKIKEKDISLLKICKLCNFYQVDLEDILNSSGLTEKAKQETASYEPHSTGDHDLQRVHLSERRHDFFLAKKKEQEKTKQKEQEKNVLGDQWAYDFLVLEIPSQVVSFEMQNKKLVGSHWERMIEDYNDTVIVEQLEFIPSVLLARLRKYCRSWVYNLSVRSGKQSQKPLSSEEVAQGLMDRMAF